MMSARCIGIALTQGSNDPLCFLENLTSKGEYSILELIASVVYVVKVCLARAFKKHFFFIILSENNFFR